MKWRTSFLRADTREDLIALLNELGAEPIQFVEIVDRVSGCVIQYGVWTKQEVSETSELSRRKQTALRILRTDDGTPIADKIEMAINALELPEPPETPPNDFEPGEIEEDLTILGFATHR
ncbi:MAG: hypothetical protein A2312_01620 [Candidatus Staskawiczbacteria bacterium RIFOXYB2_FULL_32_9]|uniref:Uncharacterized protein n=1 Tax=Candidatus Staskawiczbacteria bacterium RIFOXYD1_FULL_32_13 TaxID=1802234 RepID=A0A1G2JNW2_9BACT|nr:MAG: hypothetical protein UR22_C0010G0023 [Parcubacteria group bacterium GW2011_GWC2_32_10]OGZ79006.1 MAG: hypothetical protein A2360_02995 [Candidatus Staskawiczbacteria bacterium RIFOXYB1_FULL_32_11]OGZ80892.1 MAG: hypothetical protein A2256_03615 [Candidatus Staskawiczbacteria bacterium RIFOXYA2_FULL_32_7]OGZ82962.1 MAG: hypothetical protein A2312_01620 [Candidatus Staskawiczbacteria bacterium RIFOXYB2_FULL_32_9]OGZ88266.1 MAG: hypothetical protein A2463_01500 [Candidatus Staskawiczbacter